MPELGFYLQIVLGYRKESNEHNFVEFILFFVKRADFYDLNLKA